MAFCPRAKLEIQIQKSVDRVINVAHFHRFNICDPINTYFYVNS